MYGVISLPGAMSYDKPLYIAMASSVDQVKRISKGHIAMNSLQMLVTT